MGKRGPIGDSDNDKWLKGTGAKPADQTSPATRKAQGAPTMPADLPPAAKTIWRKLVPKLNDLGRLTPLDGVAVADMVLCICRLKECEDDITARGVLVAGDRGPVKNPSLQAAREYRAALQRWSQRFGLTPGDRDRIEEAEEPDGEKTPLAEYLFRAATHRAEELGGRNHE
jgi:P27 family predicted phage terminase small subunit